MKFERIDDARYFSEPVRSTEHSAGYDLTTVDTVVLGPGQIKLVGTNTKLVGMASNCVGLVCPRSGLAAKYGVTVLNAPGIIDADYNGEIQVILHNAGGETVVIRAGDRVAQLVITRFDTAQGTIVSDTIRTGGFGSTGT